MDQPTSLPKDSEPLPVNTLTQESPFGEKGYRRDQPHKVGPNNALGIDGEPILPFYCCFYCCAKRILINPLNAYYDIICNYIYTTDGKLFIGKYKNNIVDHDSEIPDIRYCCPCYTIQIIIC